MAGLIQGILVVIVSLSFAAFVFGGPLTPYLSRGLGIGLLSGIILSLIVALFSSVRTAIACPQDTIAAVLVVIVATIAGAVAARAPAQVLPTTLVGIALTSLAIGLFFLVLGLFRLGRFIRFIPYPVIGGFLAGTGWVLLRGAISTMSDTPFSWSSSSELTTAALHVLPGAALGLLLLILLRRFSHAFITPVTLLAAVLLFYLVAWLTHTSFDQLKAMGWLLGPFPSGGLWQPLELNIFSQVDWAALSTQAASLLSTLLVGSLALLLNVTGMELALRQDIDVDRELRVAGVANLLTSLGGGLGGYQTFSVSVLGHRLGATSRLAGIVAAGVSVLALLAGATVLVYLPKFVLGGLLLSFALDLLLDWLYFAWFKLPKLEYALVVLIMLVIGFSGFLSGVLAGVAIAVLLFTINYSQTTPIKHALTGATFQSKMERPIDQKQLLREQGARMYILELQGYLFFGTANSLLEQAQARLDTATSTPVRFLVLDFRRVTGIDSSAVFSFTKLLHLAEARGITLVVTEASLRVRKALLSGASSEGDAKNFHFYPDLDRGVEWCESQILQGEGVETPQESPLSKQFSGRLMLPNVTALIMKYLEPLQLAAGDYFIHQGEDSNDLFFVESGQVTVVLNMPDGKQVRFRTAGAGTLMGEISFYQGIPRTASVIADEPTIVFRLTREALARMQERDPAIAAAMHEWIATVLAGRVADMTATVSALLY